MILNPLLLNRLNCFKWPMSKSKTLPTKQLFKIIRLLCLMIIQQFDQLVISLISQIKAVNSKSPANTNVIQLIVALWFYMTMTMTMTMNMFLLPCNTYMIDTTNHIHKNSSSLLSFGTKIHYNCTWQKGLEVVAYVPQYLLYKVIV